MSLEVLLQVATTDCPNACVICTICNLKRVSICWCTLQYKSKGRSQDQIAAIDPKPYKSPRHSIFITEKSHFPVIATIPNGTKLGTEESIKVNLQTTNGTNYSEVLSNYDNGSKFLPTWKVLKVQKIFEFPKTYCNCN